MLRPALMSLAILSLAANCAFAGEARQFRGPDRDGKFDEQGLLKAWPEGGPALLWETDAIGKGYASPTIVGDTLYVPGMLETNDGYLFAFSMDGRERWRLKYGQETEDSQAPGARSTLTVDGGSGYLISGLGVLYRIDLAQPAITWEVNLLERFQGKQIQWAIAESPLVDEKYVYCMPGGPDSAFAALDKATGGTVWTTEGLGDASAYCSPNIITHNGRRIIVSMTAKGLIGADADTGALLWTRDHPDQWDIHANTPVYADGMLYFVAGSKAGGVMLELSPDGSKISQKWTDTDMDTLHGGVVLHEGHIYGTSHRSGKEMLCLELKTGKIKWRTPDVTEGALVYADGMLYNYEGPMAGVVSLIEATPKEFNRTGKFKIAKGDAKHWAHPVIAGGRMYIRRGEHLWAYDVKAK